jgi:hypothetical protein
MSLLFCLFFFFFFLSRFLLFSDSSFSFFSSERGTGNKYSPLAHSM